jgi:magnesium transporter
MDLDAASIVSKQKFFAVPVVDSTQKLVGIVNTSQLLSDMQEEYSTDIQTIFGVHSYERPFSSTVFSLRKRLPWLNINLATAFLAGAVVALFESTIAAVTVLAVFLPIVASQGGTAARVLAVVMGLVMRGDIKAISQAPLEGAKLDPHKQDYHRSLRR